ncbi:MAG: TonB-dependent receptor [Pseudomonadales bacterium]|nr:TonB-dependent receptor [Pseudomonadales bacterium]
MMSTHRKKETKQSTTSKRIQYLGLSAITLAVMSYSAALAAEEKNEALDLPDMEVSGAAQEEGKTQLNLQLLAPNDTAEYLRSVPGASVNQNGPLTGIAQYRGFFGERVNVLVGGTHIKPTCANSMDPPLSHIPPSLVDSIELKRGIAPVSSGIETIGGSIVATPFTNEFGLSDEFESSGRVSAGYKSVSQGSQLSVFAGTANDNHRVNASISAEQGDDYEYPRGDVSPTEYERSTYGLGYGYLRDDYELDFSAHYNDTGVTGTPALPMDIIYSEAFTSRVGIKVGLEENRQLDAHFSAQQGEHQMDNFTLRAPPTMGMKRISDAEVDSLGYGVKYTFPMEDGNLVLGVDGDTATHSSIITDPTSAMWFVENFNEAERNRAGVFAEWEGDATDALSVTVGARMTQIDMDSAAVGSSMAMMMPMSAAAQLVKRFNSADRSRSDNNFDVALDASYALSETLSLEAGVAQKTRSPSYQERFLWMPLESTGGLADGNSYVGDLNLDPEVAHQLELGFSWDNKTAYFAPRTFYHRVDDYIQGIPASDSIVIAASMGDPTPLQYANVDAVLYGFDTPFGYQLSSSISLDGQVSYVRGERDDINDNLYRIAPLNGLLAVSYTQNNWSLTGEVEGFAAQNEVSATNSEKETAGYGLVNLKGSYRPKHNIELMAGIENVMDKDYAQHLAGYSRVDVGEISKGDRLPGKGRNLFITAALEW